MSILILAHVVTGLVGIASGLVVVVGLFRGRPMPRWTATFLATTGAACATGFVSLPTLGVTSAQLVGFYSAALLAVAAYARYARRLRGSWRPVYAMAVVAALFLNVLIATTQSFQHVRVLRALSPTQHGPAFIAVKVALLSLAIVTAFVLAKRGGQRA